MPTQTRLTRKLTSEKVFTQDVHIIQRTGHTIETIRDDPHLDINHGKGLLSAAVVSRHSVHGLRDVVQNQIQIHLILLWADNKKANTLSHRVKSVRLNSTYIYNFSESIYKVSSVWKRIMTLESKSIL